MEILKNKKLINEMKRVLQILPFGVIIWPSEKKEKWFTNQEFTKKFTKIRKDLDELAEIDISFVHNNDEDNAYKKIPKNLSTLLRYQQQMLNEKDCMTEKDIKIK